MKPSPMTTGQAGKVFVNQIVRRLLVLELRAVSQNKIENGFNSPRGIFHTRIFWGQVFHFYILHSGNSEKIKIEFAELHYFDTKSQPGTKGHTLFTTSFFGQKQKILVVDFSIFKHIFRCVRHARCRPFDSFVKCYCSRYL